MESTITSTARRINARRGGFTATELLIAISLSGIVLAAMISYGIFSTRSVRAIGNFVVLDMNSRNALDTMSHDIRQANGCSTNSGQFTSANLTLVMTDPNSGTNYTINYNYSTTQGTLTRTTTITNNVQATVLLTNCSWFAFSYFQRNPSNGVWDAYPVDSSRPDECKLVQMSWTCSRTVLGSMVNADSVESAKVVIRKE